MIERTVQALAAAAGRNRAWLLALTAGLLALAAFAVPRLPFDNSLETMLPEGSRAQGMIRYLREAGLSENVVVTLSCDAEVPAASCAPLLRQAVDAMGAWVQPPLITGLLTPGAASAAGGGWSMAGLVPVLFDAEQEAQLRALLEPGALQGRLRELFRRQLGPPAPGAGDVRADPLGLEEALLRRALATTTALGFRLVYRDGLLLDESGRHALVLMQTAAPVTDSQAARELVAHIESGLAALPPGVSGTYVCAHRHTVSNEELLRRDIAITAVAETVIFFLMLVVCFRDPRTAVLIFLIPPAAALLALPLTAWATGTLAYLVVGLGTVIAGISVDYGIHAFVATRHARSGAAGAAHAAGPVINGMLTVSALFAAFAFSAIAGYRQLAAFAVFSLILSVLLALGLLPHLVPVTSADAPAPPASPLLPARRRDRVVLLLWILFVLAALPAFRSVRFDGRLSQLDGITDEIRAAEAALDAQWRAGGARQAIVAVAAKDLESALTLQHRIYERMRAGTGTEGVVTMASLWPGAEVREANRARWRRFWSGVDGQALAAAFPDAARSAGFSPTAFAPFLERTRQEVPPVEPAAHPLLKPLWGRLVHPRGDAWHVFAYVPDEPARLDVLEESLRDMPEARVVSTHTVDRALSSTFTGEIRRITAFALLGVVAMMGVLVRRPRLILAALVPPVSGVAGLIHVMAATGLQGNVLSLMAGIVVFGLSMDYSYTMMHGLKHRTEGISRLVVNLSAITTVVGAGVLLLARHPALFSIGVTLTLGVVCGYVGALLVIPALARVWRLAEAEHA